MTRILKVKTYKARINLFTLEKKKIDGDYTCGIIQNRSNDITKIIIAFLEAFGCSNFDG